MMPGLSAAIGLEWAKLRRATAMWAGTLVLVAVVPSAAAGLVAAAASTSDSQLAVKARGMIVGAGWEPLAAVAGQILAVAVLIVVGVVACWMFGREFADRTVTGLAAQPTGTGTVAVAKFVVLLGWGLAVTIATAAATLLAGAITVSTAPSGAAWVGLGRLAVAAVVTVVLTTPVALAASAGRGPLTGVAVLFGLLVVTQIATVAGLGGWFPYAAPGLWLGLGGPEAAGAITVPQLLLGPVVGVVGAAATTVWWRHRATAARS